MPVFPVLRPVAIVVMAATVLFAGDVLAAGRAAPAALLPDRTLTCRVGHVINFDPAKAQTMAELRYDTAHDFALFLPSIPARTAPPPEADEKPEPVDRRTRILSDPDRISPQPRGRFDRVVDYWPDRVELSSTIAGPLRSVVMLDKIDRTAGTANIVMMRASELTHFDPAHIYQGQCRFGAAGGPTSGA